MPLENREPIKRKNLPCLMNTEVTIVLSRKNDELVAIDSHFVLNVLAKMDALLLLDPLSCHDVVIELGKYVQVCSTPSRLKGVRIQADLQELCAGIGLIGRMARRRVIIELGSELQLLDGDSTFPIFSAAHDWFERVIRRTASDVCLRLNVGLLLTGNEKCISLVASTGEVDYRVLARQNIVLETIAEGA